MDKVASSIVIAASEKIGSGLAVSPVLVPAVGYVLARARASGKGLSANQRLALGRSLNKALAEGTSMAQWVAQGRLAEEAAVAQSRVAESQMGFVAPVDKSVVPNV